MKATLLDPVKSLRPNNAGCRVRGIPDGLRGSERILLQIYSRNYIYLLCDSTRTKRRGPKSKSAEFSSVLAQLDPGVVRLDEELKRSVEEILCHW